MQLRLRPTTTVSFWRCFKRDGPSVKLVTGSELRPKNRLTLRAVIFTPFRSNLGFAFAYEAPRPLFDAPDGFTRNKTGLRLEYLLFFSNIL